MLVDNMDSQYLQNALLAMITSFQGTVSKIIFYVIIIPLSK